MGMLLWRRDGFRSNRRVRKQEELPNMYPVVMAGDQSQNSVSLYVDVTCAGFVTKHKEGNSSWRVGSFEEDEESWF